MIDVQATLAALDIAAQTLKTLESVNRELRRDLDGTCVTLNKTEADRDRYMKACNILQEALSNHTAEAISAKFSAGDMVFVRTPNGVVRRAVQFVQIKRYPTYTEVAYGFHDVSGVMHPNFVFADADAAFGG